MLPQRWGVCGFLQRWITFIHLLVTKVGVVVTEISKCYFHHYCEMMLMMIAWKVCEIQDSEPVSWYNIQLTLEKHEFEPHRCTYTELFTVQYCKCIFLMLFFFFLMIFFSLVYFIVRILYIIHITYKICVNWLLGLCFFIRLPVNNKLFVVKFLTSKNFHADFWLCRGSVPQPLHCSRINYTYNMEWVNKSYSQFIALMRKHFSGYLH